MAAALVALQTGRSSLHGYPLPQPQVQPPSTAEEDITTEHILSLSAANASELDDLALQASTNPSSFFQLVEMVKPRLYSFGAAQQLDTETDHERELIRVKEHLSKLKLSFLHLESKQKFLTMVEENTHIPEITEEELQQIAALITSTKKEIDVARAETDSIRSRIKDSIALVVQRWSELETSTAAFQASFSPSLHAEALDIIQQICDDNIENGLNAEWIQQQLHREREQMKQQMIQSEKVEAEISLMQQEIEQLQTETEVIQQQNTVLKQSLPLSLFNDEANAAEQQNMANESRWYSAVTEALSALNGIEIKRPSAESRSLLITIRAASLSVCIEVDAVQRTQRFNGAKLVSGKFDAALFDEIMDYALEIQDLRFLCREIQANLFDQEDELAQKTDK